MECGNMGVFDRGVQMLLTTVGAFAAFSLMTIAVGTDYWLYSRGVCKIKSTNENETSKKNEEVMTHSGLWRTCCLEGEPKDAVYIHAQIRRQHSGRSIPTCPHTHIHTVLHLHSHAYTYAHMPTLFCMSSASISTHENSLFNLHTPLLSLSIHLSIYLSIYLSICCILLRQSTTSPSGSCTNWAHTHVFHSLPVNLKLQQSYDPEN